jgi:DNA replication protein DnaC
MTVIRRNSFVAIVSFADKQTEVFYVLVIDDWGLAPLGDMECRDVLELLEDRYDQGSVIITSQLAVKQWHALVGDATLADAILDRIVHNSHRVILDGDTMRKPENRKKGLKKEGKDE